MEFFAIGTALAAAGSCRLLFHFCCCNTYPAAPTTASSEHPPGKSRFLCFTAAYALRRHQMLGCVVPNTVWSRRTNPDLELNGSNLCLLQSGRSTRDDDLH
eukprot:6186425-Pleurochrysis_carterae.AAC.2